jgi:hypothetical protein
MSEARRNFASTVAASIVIVAGSVAFYYAADFATLRSVWTRTAALVVMVLSLVYVGVTLLQPETPRRPGRALSPLRRGLIVATLAAWALLLVPMGFLLTTIIAYSAALFIAGYDRWTPPAAVLYTALGMLALGALYATYAYEFHARLPADVW